MMPEKTELCKMLGTLFLNRLGVLKAGEVQETLHEDDDVQAESVTITESRPYKHQHRKLKGRNANDLMPCAVI